MKRRTLAEVRFKRWSYYMYVLRRVLPHELLVAVAVLVFRIIGETRWDRCRTQYYKWTGSPSVRSYMNYVRLERRLPLRFTHHDWEANWKLHNLIPEHEIRKAVEERDGKIDNLIPMGRVQSGDDIFMLYDAIVDNSQKDMIG